MKAKRVDNVMWACRKLGAWPNAYVTCRPNGDLELHLSPGDGFSYCMKMQRGLARLLAKRIVQCIEETR